MVPKGSDWGVERAGETGVSLALLYTSISPLSETETHTSLTLSCHCLICSEAMCANTERKEVVEEEGPDQSS